jgi:hypothetical protein
VCVVSGRVDEDAKDSALIALSFNRAHAAWLEQRYGGLDVDPRQRRKGDWLISLTDMGAHYQGPSLGAAFAGTHPAAN